ncbi:MAG: MBL fold metallo-hydrolase [Candidatus Brocadiia bacterium]
MKVISLQVGPLATNAYLVVDEESGSGAVIDPGAEPERIAQRCRDEAMEVLFIVNTHAHADHVGGNEGLKREFPDAELCIGAGDAERLADEQANLSAAFGLRAGGAEPDRRLHEGDRLECGQVTLEVIETPGHTPGAISLLAREQEPPQLFCGDLLFRDGVGRTDFPGGDWSALVSSIRDKTLVLPEETVVWPGHGERTTVGRERRAKQFPDTQS